MTCVRAPLLGQGTRGRTVIGSPSTYDPLSWISFGDSITLHVLIVPQLLYPP